MKNDADDVAPGIPDGARSRGRGMGATAEGCDRGLDRDLAVNVSRRLTARKGAILRHGKEQTAKDRGRECAGRGARTQPRSPLQDPLGAQQRPLWPEVFCEPGVSRAALRVDDEGERETPSYRLLRGAESRVIKLSVWIEEFDGSIWCRLADSKRECSCGVVYLD